MFWCTEAAFRSVKGVKHVEVGYMGGRTANPTYKEVCTGRTGHAEVSRVTFDPSQVSYEKLLDVFWKIHDPTTLNKQGNDIGSQYRSAIFYHSDGQKDAAERSMAELAKGTGWKIVTGLEPAADFYRAEDYHQDFYNNNRSYPYCRLIIDPKLKKLEAALPAPRQAANGPGM